MSADGVAKDGILAAARSAMMIHNAKVDGERNRLQALISRHTAKMDSLGRQGGRHLLEAVGSQVARRMNEKHGTNLEARVSGPYGLGPDWYLYLKDAHDPAWAIVKFVGGVETMTIRKEGERGPGVPFPDDLEELVGMFEDSRVEDGAEKAAGGRI